MSFKKTFGAIALVLTLAIAASAIANSGQPASVEATQSQEIVDSGLSGPETSQRPDSITVLLEPNGLPSAVQAAASGFGGQLIRDHQRSGLQVFSFPNGIAAANAAEALSHNPNVEDVTLTFTASIFETPDDPFFNYQWHLHDTAAGVRAEPAWDLAPSNGSGVVVAVIDTGVAYESFSRPASPGLPAMSFQPAPDLAGVGIADPYNYVYDDSHANDDHSHGSHVTGTIAQATNNAYGMAGLASDVTIMPIKVLDYAGSGMDADLVDAIYYAVDNGADVITMSLGFTGTGSPDANGVYCTEILDLNDALDYAYANGVVVVAASGNESGSNVSCPAAYPTVIAVGASTYAAAIASYSNRGDALDVVAPGGDPNADLNGDGYSDGVLQETFCNPGAYIIFLGIITGTANFNSFCAVFMSGTSMATPHVTGIVALLLGENPSLAPDGVRALIESTARDGGPEGWDSAFGYGIIDAAAALAALTGAPTPTPTASPTVAPSPTATPAPTEDTVTVTKVSYNKGKDELKVEAASSASPDAVLTVYDNSDPSSPVELGVMSYNSRRDRYSAAFDLPSPPSEILVVSSEGGQDVYVP